MIESGYLTIGLCNNEMLIPEGVQHARPQSPAPSRGRFSGWRVVLVGAFLIAIAGAAGTGNFVGLPSVAGRTLDGLDEVYPGSSLWFLSKAIFTQLIPALLMPLIGYGVDRWGPRRMVVGGLALISSGFVLYLGSGVSWLPYPTAAVFAIGGVAASHLPMAAAVNYCFSRRRATAMGFMIMLSWVFRFGAVLTLGTPLIFLAPVNAQAALLATAALLLALIWPIRILLGGRPENTGGGIDGAGPSLPDNDNPVLSTDDEPLTPGYGWLEAMKSRVFWLLVIGGAELSINAAQTFYITDLVSDREFSFRFAAVLVMSVAVTAAPFSVIGGWLGDRFPIRRVLFGFALVACAGVLVMAFAQTAPMFYFSAVLAGVGSGATTTLTLAVIAVYFGRRNFGTILGMYLFITSTLQLFSPTLFGMAMVAIANWTLTLLIFALGTAGTSLAYFFAGAPGSPRPRDVQSPTGRC